LPRLLPRQPCTHAQFSSSPEAIDLGGEVSRVSFQQIAAVTLLRANDNNNMFASSASASSGNSFAFNPLNNVEVLALAGNDTITVSDGSLLANAVVRAAEGNDSISLGSSGAVNTSLFGGAGNDSINLAGALVSDQLQSLTGNNHFSVQSTTLASLQSGSGNDTVLANQGNDLQFGEDRDDLMLYDDAVNKLFTDGGLVDAINGGTGTNTIRPSFNNPGTMGYTISFTDELTRAETFRRSKRGPQTRMRSSST
jgi:hypothetical protein